MLYKAHLKSIDGKEIDIRFKDIEEMVKFVTLYINAKEAEK